MNESIENRDSDLVIIGLALRTRPQDAAKNIPGHWQRFMREGIAGIILARKDDANRYAVYCDYESDHRGPYTMVLGAAVDPGAAVPEGLVRVRVPAGNYARFGVTGDPSKLIWQTWGYINGEWPGKAGRRYLADVERYRPGGTPQCVEADILVGMSWTPSAIRTRTSVWRSLAAAQDGSFR